MVAVVRADRRTRWDEPAGGCAVDCCLTERNTRGVETSVGCGLVGGLEIVDCACSGAGARSSAYHVPWRFKYLSDERTERGTAVLVAGFDCYVVCNVFVIIVRSAIFQDGKRVVPLCVSLMDGSHQTYIGWCCGII